MADTVAAFFAALAKRRLNLKTAAYLGDGHPKMLERLQRAETRTLDAAFVARLAAKLEDGPAFVGEIFATPKADPLAEIRADLAAIKDRLAVASDSWWFDEYGRRFAALPDFETAARLALNLPAGIDASAFAQRNLGWVGVQDGVLVSNAAAAAKALASAQAFLGNAEEAQPRGWQVATASIAAGLPREFDNLVFARGIGALRDALQATQLMDRSSLYAIERDRVTTIWLGAEIKTSAEAIGFPLAARADRPFAAMLERHVRSAAACGAKLWHLAGIETAGVRASYDRLALPTSDRRFVAHVVSFKSIEKVTA